MILDFVPILMIGTIVLNRATLASAQAGYGGFSPHFSRPALDMSAVTPEAVKAKAGWPNISKLWGKALGRGGVLVGFLGSNPGPKPVKEPPN